MALCVVLIVMPMSKPEQVLVLFGSPNKKGYTHILTSLYLEQLQNKLHNQMEIEYIYAYEKKYLPCLGCEKCDTTGVCIWNQKDQYDQLLEKIQQADTVVLASPVYFSGFPAPLKALIDRAQQKYAVKFKNGKGVNQKLRRGVLISTCGADTTKFFPMLQLAAGMFFDCLDIGIAETLFASNTDDPGNIKISDMEQKARDVK
ncbi:MAG: hypothetical protein DBX37_00605 [Massilioclostridium sp.]|nr:MAG: hypothetical protein DBX37_00605 [Massilioclostridium sp.]